MRPKVCGAELSGIEVAHIYAVTFGLGTACVAIAACLLIPSYYVNPHAGNAFVLIEFTIVVLGGMGSVAGALIAGLFHTLNHGVFKCLLFLGAGSVLDATHTRNMEQMGGLIRRMPQTAFFFLVGAVAISALPP